MQKIRIELARDMQTASTQVDVLKGLGYTVTGPDACEIAWVTDASNPNASPLVTYTDASDNQVFVVVGRKE